MSSSKLLQVKSLEADFFTEDGWVPALRDISFDVDEGGCTGVVGESGCGKSVTAMAIMGILPANVRIKRGEIIFEGRDLLKVGAAERSSLRGSAISMIFQDALSALNPVFTVGEQMRDILQTGRRKQRQPALTRRQADDEIVAMLDQVGLSSPRQRLEQYPHELSGGMRQRILIAITLLSRPRLVIADEPTTALDVTIEAQIVELIQELARKFNVTFMLITHNFNLVAELCDRVVVLYRGRSVEECGTETLFREPLHPYTRGLLDSIITPATRRGQLRPISGSVPNAREIVPGCQFNPRCPAAMDVCRANEPAFVEVRDEHRVACFLRSAATVDGIGQ